MSREPQSPAAKPTAEARSENQRGAAWSGVAIIVAGVTVWCLVHAVGAYKTSPWLSVMVLGCLLMFLLLWGSVLWLRQRRIVAGPAETTRAKVGKLPDEKLSFSGIASLALAMAAWGVYGLAIWGQDQSMHWQRVVSWIDIALLGIALVTALVALSEPLPKRGKLGALAALGLVLALVVTVVVRLQPPQRAAGEVPKLSTPATSVGQRGNELPLRMKRLAQTSV